MEAPEFISKFNLQYNNLNGNIIAPGLDNYEISLYLTKAYKEIISELYSGTKEFGYKNNFQSSELNRASLRDYIINISIGLKAIGFEPYGSFYKVSIDIPNNVLYIISESVTSISDMDIILVKPIKSDDIVKTLNNPYREPSKRRIYRLENDFNSIETKSVLTLITNAPIDKDYNIQAILNPEPIIVEDLTNYNETIEGISLVNIPEVLAQNYYMIDKVINRAIELATRDYKQNTLETQVQLNNR